MAAFRGSLRFGSPSFVLGENPSFANLTSGGGGGVDGVTDDNGVINEDGTDGVVLTNPGENDLSVVPSLSPPETAASDAMLVHDKDVLIEKRLGLDGLRDFVAQKAGANIGISANATINPTSGHIIAFNNEVYDTADCWEGVTNPSRVTVPSGWTKAKVTASVVLAFATFSSQGTMYLLKNGTPIEAHNFDKDSNLNGMGFWTATDLIDVVSGDYFQIKVECTDSSVDLWAPSTSLVLELIA